MSKHADWIAIAPGPLPIAEAIAAVQSPEGGGIAVFLGTTRCEKRADGIDLVALEYEAYEDMALPQLRALARDAHAKWPIVYLAILHCVGEVPLKQPSVVIAVSTAHRAQAFEACRWLIDSLKKDVAIWKREVWADGARTWVESGG